MEDLMKRSVSNQQSGYNGAEFEDDSRRPEAPSFSSDSSSNLDPASTIAGENSQGSDFGLPSPEGKFESAMHFPDLSIFSILLCSR